MRQRVLDDIENQLAVRLKCAKAARLGEVPKLPTFVWLGILKIPISTQYESLRRTLGVQMEMRTVYMVNCNRASDQLALRGKLNTLANSILVSDMIREVMACHIDCREDDVVGWLERCNIRTHPPTFVIRAAMLTVCISTHRNEVARAIARAHQRLMLKYAHLNDIDLSISL